jgi:hypothetical protein
MPRQRSGQTEPTVGRSADRRCSRHPKPEIEIRLVAGGTTRGSGCAPLCEYEATPEIIGSSMGATPQAEIDPRSQELEIRRVPDNARLSDTAAKQLAGARQRDGRKGSVALSGAAYPRRSGTPAASLREYRHDRCRPSVPWLPLPGRGNPLGRALVPTVPDQLSRSRGHARRQGRRGGSHARLDASEVERRAAQAQVAALLTDQRAPPAPARRSWWRWRRD